MSLTLSLTLVFAPFASKATRQALSTARIATGQPGARKGAAERRMRNCTRWPVRTSSTCWRTRGRHKRVGASPATCLSPNHPTPHCQRTCPPCLILAQTSCWSRTTTEQASSVSWVSPTLALPRLSGEQSWLGSTWRGGAVSHCMWWGRGGRRSSRRELGQVGFVFFMSFRFWLGFRPVGSQAALSEEGEVGAGWSWGGEEGVACHLPAQDCQPGSCLLSCAGWIQGVLQ